MIILDGHAIKSRPITLAELECGCFEEYDGHEIEVGEVVDCDLQPTCTNLQFGPVQIRGVVRTAVLD